MILRKSEGQIAEKLEQDFEEAVENPNEVIFGSTINKSLFIVNDPTVSARPKRVMHAAPSKLRTLQKGIEDRQAWNYFSYVPDDKVKTKLPRFSS